MPVIGSEIEKVTEEMEQVGLVKKILALVKVCIDL
jgi:hypothetical protein